MKRPSNAIIVGGLLAVVTFITFAPVLEAGFVGYDDAIYITGNDTVQRGLNWQTAVWAAGATLDGNWFPLTWFSHLLDCQLYGLKPAGHHLTNVLLHIFTTLLLLGLLHRMTGDLWPSAVTAALFALHPLHVESVAWVAERKDVLSALFGVLTLWAYGRYAEVRSVGTAKRPSAEARSSVLRPPSSFYYWLALLFFICGLMSKPMLVTLPFVMLLLDWWPLRRLQPSTVPRLLLEKTPFFILTAISSWVTFHVQKQGGAMAGTEGFPLASRAGNALVAYVRYLGKTVWPQDLAVFYPHPGSWPGWMVVAAAVLLLGISALVVFKARMYPYLLVGWLWFLGMLVPVIGIVQVGIQAMADRYTYLPLIGVFLPVAWGTFEWRRRHAHQAALLTACVVALLMGCAIATRAQLRHWQDGVALFERALAVTPANAVALGGLGNALEGLGRIDEAMQRYRQALELKPDAARANYNLGNCLFQKGQLTDAAHHYQRALRSAPDAAQTHNNLAVVLAQLGRADEAAGHFRKVLAREPDNARVHHNLALTLRKLGDARGAARHFAEVVRLKPQDARAHYDLGLAQLQAGQETQAVAHLGEALTRHPALLTELNNRAWLLATHPDASTRDGRQAIALAGAALDYSGPWRPLVLDTLAAAHAEVGQFAFATNFAHQALALSRAANDPALAEEISRRLALYCQGQPHREPPREP